MTSLIQMSTQSLIPHPARIDIWQYSLSMSFSDAIFFLSDQERQRAAQYYFERHRRRFTIARAMMRLILSRYTNIPAETLEFSENKYGKPYLKHLPAFQFNLSHSDELALLAVGEHSPLGVDIECYQARPYEGIGRHSFSPFENQALQASPDAFKAMLFFHIWTQKEALIKACGLGLSYPTQQFNASINLTPHAVIHDTLYDKTWNMLSFTPKIASPAALCYPDGIQEIRYIPDVSPASLMHASSISSHQLLKATS